MTGNESGFDRDSDVPDGSQGAERSAAAAANKNMPTEVGHELGHQVGPGTSVAGNPDARPSPRMVTRICLALAVVLLMALFLSRAFAQRYDFSVANVLVLILGFFAWLSLTIGLASSRLPRWQWRSLALTPVIAIIIGLSLYRVVRINGELVPVFESRWQSAAPLVTEPSAEQAAPLPAALFEPRETDFPQYLGPNRNAVIDNVRLETDWVAHPPEILWKQPIGHGWSGFAVQGDAAVTLEQREEEQWVSCYEVETGRMLWHTAVPGYHFNALGGAGPRSTPTIAGNRVYAHMATGPLVCLELTSGAKVWEVDLLALGGWDQKAAESEVSWGRSGSPLVVKDMVVVPLGGRDEKKNSLVAVRTSDGEVVWRAGTDQISYSSPMLAKLQGVEQIVIVNEKTITAHAIDSGNQLWSVPWDGKSNGPANTSQPVWIDDSHLLISKGYATGCELVQLSRRGKDWSHEVVWKEPHRLKTKLTSAVVRDGFAYGLSDGILECIQVSDGQQQWKKGRYRQGQVLLVGDVLLITAENGSLVLVAADPSGFKELARLDDVLGDVTWNTPALSGDRLLMRNADEAAALRLPGFRLQTSGFRKKNEE